MNQIGAINSLVVGLGKIGSGYDIDVSGKIIPKQIMSHCKAISLSKEYELKYVYDLNQLTTDRVSRLYNAIPINRFQDVLYPTPEFIVIAVPTEFHVETVRSVLEIYQPRFLIVEKPMGANLSQANSLAIILRESGARVLVNYTRRFMPIHSSALEYLRKRDMGRLEHITIKSYGSLINTFSHFLDLLVLYLGEEFTSLSFEMLNYTESLIHAIDIKNNFHLLLEGINQAETESSILIQAELLDISIVDNGFKVCISSKEIPESIVEFEADKFERDCYQTWVLKALKSKNRDFSSKRSISSALTVHKVIQALESLHAG